MENKRTRQTAKWYHYVFAFIAGTFLANAVPHYVSGISGNSFPSPFGDPPGFGLSSPTVNVLWGAANLLVGYVLLRYSARRLSERALVALVLAGIVAAGVLLSLAFSGAIPQPG
jgi:FtsH-binding integral membrane protein